MRRHTHSLAAAIALAALGTLAAAPAAAQGAHPAAEAFRAYQRAAVERDGSAAAELVTNASIEFYERCRRAALTMEREELSRQSPVMRYTTLSLRIDFDAAALRAMDGRGVLARMVDDGQLGAGVRSFVVGDVHPGPRRTLIDVRHEDGRHVGQLTMRREEGAWRVDLLALIAEASENLERMAARSPFPGGEQGAMYAALAMMYRDRVDERIWIPLARR